MNNTDFRRFVLDTPRKPEDASPGSNAKPGGAASLLGSRSKSNIPMTPRTVKGGPSVNFARQLAEHNAASQPTKKIRSSAAPKGVKLGEGYTDRALQRATESDDAEAAARDEREARVQALEEQMKLGQIDRETFENLRDSITGGDIRATHLVKGLDRQLLERVRKGEDVLKGGDGKKSTAVRETTPGPDAEEEFARLERNELAPIGHERVEKKGEMAPPPKPVAGTKRSRNDILAELKASRKAAEEAKAASQPQLGSKFKKLGGQSSSTEPRIERDERGREVLITVDENGRVKRKVRKVAKDDKPAPEGLLMPDKNVKPLGMVVPEPTPPPAKIEEEDDDDIFEGVGDSYDPLGAADEDDSSSSESNDEPPPNRQTTKTGLVTAPSSDAAVPAPPSQHDSAEKASAEPTLQPVKHNYFNDTTTSPEEPIKGLNDPNILETLKRAAAMRLQSTAADESEDPSSVQPDSSAAQRLLQRDRDLDDIDMGFGSSRFGDEDDDGGDGSRLKLSEWKGGFGGDDDDGDEKGRGGQKQRKRGKKKKKGDKDSAADVMRVIEGRKK